MDYDLDNCPRSAHALRNRISSSGNAGRDLSIQTDAVIKVDVDNDDVEKYRRLVGILDLESEANVARRVSSREAAANQVQIYNASGNQVATTQIDNHILWNTRRRDALTGYYLYKFRHYSAELGRWLARDPIEEDGGVNLYAFVGNDPVGRWDKLGQNVPRAPLPDFDPVRPPNLPAPAPAPAPAGAPAMLVPLIPGVKLPCCGCCITAMETINVGHPQYPFGRNHRLFGIQLFRWTINCIWVCKSGIVKMSDKGPMDALPPQFPNGFFNCGKFP